MKLYFNGNSQIVLQKHCTKLIVWEPHTIAISRSSSLPKLMWWKHLVFICIALMSTEIEFFSVAYWLFAFMCVYVTSLFLTFVSLSIDIVLFLIISRANSFSRDSHLYFPYLCSKYFFPVCHFSFKSI